MSRDVYLVVEGPTEQLFVERVLAPHLSGSGLYFHATQIPNRGGRGGDVRFERAARSVENFLKQRPDTLVGTFFDYYGLREWPRLEEVHALNDPAPATIAQTLNEAATVDLISRLPDIDVRNRFVPFLAVHEFEALLFSDAARLSSGTGIPERLIRAALDEAGEPERIDRGPETAPSNRLASWMNRRYGKTTTGIAVAQSIGIPAMRAACPNFDAWLCSIENVAGRRENN